MATYIKHADSGLVEVVRGVERVPNRQGWSNITDMARITYTILSDAFRIMNDREVEAFKAKNGGGK